MKRAIMLAIAASALIPSQSDAQGANQDIGTAFTNYGWCSAVISKYFTFDWKEQKAKNGERYNQYDHEVTCRKIGDYWYIVPIIW